MRTEGSLHALEWTLTGDEMAAPGDLGLYLYDFNLGSPPAD